jgi:hypothetical protein
MRPEENIALIKSFPTTCHMTPAHKEIELIPDF